MAQLNFSTSPFFSFALKAVNFHSLAQHESSFGWLGHVSAMTMKTTRLLPNQPGLLTRVRGKEGHPVRE